jgi:glycosyltransferase involved in cell wall biosynthesis
MRSLPQVTYLSMDATDEGVGASQVVPYVERLARRGIAVELHTFEKRQPSPTLATALATSGVTWHPHVFGAFGSKGALRRIAIAARAARRSELVHARGDLSAAACLVGRPRSWLWDVRALFADQRIATGTLRRGSVEHRILRAIERRSACSSDGVVTLASTAVDELARRHGCDLASRASVIPTCVDLSRFTSSALPHLPLRLLLIGTLNTFYDVPAMLALVASVRRIQGAELHVLTPGPTPWDAMIDEAATRRSHVPFEEVPAELRSSHVGLSICRDDAGPSLRAAMPTKVAEFLASGRPVVVNAQLGDAGRLIEQYSAGVVMSRAADADAASRELIELVSDPGLPDRCRQLAEDHFDLDAGVDRLIARYTAMVAAT